jgi:hypothetical protein
MNQLNRDIDNEVIGSLMCQGSVLNALQQW